MPSVVFLPKFSWFLAAQLHVVHRKMPSPEKKHLESLLKPLLKKEGFLKKGGTWWRHTPNFIQVINVQASQWSKTFHINLGLYISGLGSKEWPPEVECHLRNRLENIYGHESGIHDELDFTGKDYKKKKCKKLIEMLANGGLEWLSKCSNLEHAKEECKIPNRITSQWQRELIENYFAQQNF